MKKIGLLFLSISLFVASCKKSDNCPYRESSAAAPSNEKTQLQDYLTAAGITAQVHASGAYYVIQSAGTGTTTANVCSGITVKYRGTLFPSGQLFDENSTGVSFPLGGLIVGWQKLLPLIKPGGKIDMYIPPALGYGYQNITNNTGAVVIPASSYLKFEVELLSIQ